MIDGFFIGGFIFGIIISSILLRPNTQNKNYKNGCVNVPVANFKPPSKPATRPPSQYKKIELSKGNICEINKRKCCSNVNSGKLK